MAASRLAAFFPITRVVSTLAISEPLSEAIFLAELARLDAQLLELAVKVGAF